MSAPRRRPDEALLKVKQTADLLGICERLARTLIAAGELPIVRVSARAIRVDPRDLEGFIKRRRRRGRR